MRELKKNKPDVTSQAKTSEMMLKRMQERAKKPEQPKVKKIDYKDKE